MLKGIIKVRQIPTKPKPQPFGNKNFEEFRTVYSEKNISTSCPRQRPVSVRPKKDLKTIQLEMPLLGSEKAIVIPVLKKNSKLVAKKSPIPPRHIATTKDLVKKLAKLEKEHENVNVSPTVSKTPSLKLLDKTNRELDLATIQLEQIQNMLQKKQEILRPKYPKTPVYKIVKKNSPRIRHVDCFNTKYKATLSTLQQKVASLQEKYFSKPQIVYKSINDQFTQSSDIKILYENKAYPDLKLDNALEGIINDLDCMVKGNIEQEILGSLELEDADCSSLKDTSKKVAIPGQIGNFDGRTSKNSVVSESKTELSTNLEQLFQYGRKKESNKNTFPEKDLPKQTNELDEIIDDNDEKRNNAPRNIFFKKMEPAALAKVGITNSDSGCSTKRPKKKVTFTDTIPESSNDISALHVTQTIKDTILSQEQSNCEKLVEKMYRESLSNFGQPPCGEDSIVALLDDTRTNLDTFLKLRDQTGNGKSFRQNTLSEIDNFMKSKRIYDKNKVLATRMDSGVQKIIDRTKNYVLCPPKENDVQEIVIQNNTYGTFRGHLDENISKSPLRTPVFTETKEEGVQLEDNICGIIDSSEALVKKYRDLKGNIIAVEEFCDNLSRITEDSEEENELKYAAKASNQLDGSGDERDSVESDEDFVPKSVKRSSFLMKEFSIVPSVKFFSQSESIVPKKPLIRAENYSSGTSSGVDMKTLKKNVSFALENSIFSTLEN